MTESSSRVTASYVERYIFQNQSRSPGSWPEVGAFPNECPSGQHMPWHGQLMPWPWHALALAAQTARARPFCLALNGMALLVTLRPNPSPHVRSSPPTTQEVKLTLPTQHWGRPLHSMLTPARVTYIARYTLTLNFLFKKLYSYLLVYLCYP